MFESVENGYSEQTDSLFPASLDPAQELPHAEGTDELTKLSREGYLFLKANEIDRAEAEFKKCWSLMKIITTPLSDLGMPRESGINAKKPQNITANVYGTIRGIIMRYSD